MTVGYSIAFASTFPTVDAARKSFTEGEFQADPGQYRGLWRLPPGPHGDPGEVYVFGSDEDFAGFLESGAVKVADPEQPDGPMLTAVKADIAALGDAKVPGRHTYEETCLWLADVIDKRGKDEGPAVTAKLAGELTKAMQSLTRKGGDDAKDAWRAYVDSMSTPD